MRGMDSHSSNGSVGAGAGASRRGVLALITGLGSALLAGAISVPVIGAVLDPVLRKTAGRGRWFRVARFENLDPDAPTAVAIRGERTDAWTKYPMQKLGTVWLQKRGSGVHALSAECPHLGCSVRFDESKKHFGCPCHDSSFSLDGARQGGPAPRGMDQLEARVTPTGDVEVRFLRFRPQHKEKVEV